MNLSVKNHPPVKAPAIKFHSGHRSVKTDLSSSEKMNFLDKKIKIELDNFISDPLYKDNFNNNKDFINGRDFLISRQQLENYKNNPLDISSGGESNFFESNSNDNYIKNPEDHSSPKNPSPQMCFTDNFSSEFDQISKTDFQEKSREDNVGLEPFSKIIEYTPTINLYPSLSEINKEGGFLPSLPYSITHSASGNFIESDLTQISGFIKECKNIQTLDREQQRALIDQGRNLLDNLNTKRLSDDNQTIVLQSQKGITSIENALTLSQKGKFRLSSMLLASTALGSCIASLMMLIITLIKNNSVADNTPDQAEAIEANNQVLEEAKKENDTTRQGLEELIAATGNKTDEQVKNAATEKSLLESLKQGGFVVSKNDDGSLGEPQPSQEATEIAKKSAELALKQHHENKNKLEALQGNYQHHISNIKDLYEQREELLIKQEQYKNAQENAGKTSTNVLAGIGIVGITAAISTGGVNFFNHAKRLSRKIKANKNIAEVTSPLEKNITIQNSIFNKENNFNSN